MGHWILTGNLSGPERSQHVNATYRNTVGRNMLRAFGHNVPTCCDMLGWLKFEDGQI